MKLRSFVISLTKIPRREDDEAPFRHKPDEDAFVGRVMKLTFVVGMMKILRCKGDDDTFVMSVTKVSSP